MLKIAITEIKNLLDGLHSRTDMIKEKFNELEDRLKEII